VVSYELTDKIQIFNQKEIHNIFQHFDKILSLSNNEIDSNSSEMVTDIM